ncbi:MAG: hypothetical protein IPJ78_16790 [Gemmatimonadetes bacterium]|nr:hypothetical protein [Gemmatimonadota bacterium]
MGVAGGLNLYGYGAGDPINNADPFGLCPMELTGRPCARPLALFLRLREDPGNARVGEYGRVRNNGTKNHWGLDFAALRGQAVKAVDRGHRLCRRHV